MNFPETVVNAGRDSYCVPREILAVTELRILLRGGEKGPCEAVSAPSGPRAAAFLPGCPHMAHSVSEKALIALGTSSSCSSGGGGQDCLFPKEDFARR